MGICVGVCVIVCFRNCPVERVELLVEKVVILVPCPKVGEPVDLNVGILVGTNGAIFVLRPVGKNDVLAKVGSPVPAPVPLCTRVGKNVGLNVGSFVPTPAPLPTKLGRIDGKPVNFFVGVTEGNRVPVALRKGLTLVSTDVMLNVGL